MSGAHYCVFFYRKAIIVSSRIKGVNITTVDAAVAYISRNKTLNVYDYTGDEYPVAKSWRQHHSIVDEVARGLPSGTLFALLQRRDGNTGVWVSEWTVGGLGAGKRAMRRRAAVGKTVTAAMNDFQQRLSHHHSHFFFPEEGVRGWLRHVNK